MLSLAIITEPATPPRAKEDSKEASGPEPEPELSPEDILATTIHTAYPVREVADAHGGDPGARLRYASARHGELKLRCASLTLNLDRGDDENDGGEGKGEGKEDGAGKKAVDDSAARARFGHCLWNASVLIAEMMGGERTAPPPGWDEDLDIVRVLRSAEERARWRPKGERVLELGAGLGLPGIICALEGAAEVTLTDYPSPPLIDNLRLNALRNLSDPLPQHVTVEPHLWGALDSPFAAARKHRYTRILAADTLWMSFQHASLVASMAHFLERTERARVLIVAKFHTGRDPVADFFEVAGHAGLEIKERWEMDWDGNRREWMARPEMLLEAKAWFVVAELGWVKV